MKPVIFSFFCLLTPYIYGQTKITSVLGPEITFSKSKHDFGRISEEINYAKCRFEFTNTGDQPLLINNVQTSCGCTTPEWTRDTISPGGTGFVEAKYETINRIGTFNKSITVYSNAQNAPFVHLDITGDVYKEQATTGGIPIPDLGKLYLDKPTLEFNPIFDNGLDTQVLRLVNETPYSTSILPYENLPKYCRILNWPTSLEPNEKAKITIVLDGQLIGKYGFGAFEIPLMTDNPVTPILGIYVAYTRKQYFPQLSAKELKKAPKIAFDKELHDFGNHKVGDVMSTTFTLSNKGQSDLKIHDIYPECSCIRVSYDKTVLKPGESLNLSLIFDTGSKMGVSNQGIWIVSNDPTRDEMHIYVRAQMPEKIYHCPTCK